MKIELKKFDLGLGKNKLIYYILGGGILLCVAILLVATMLKQGDTTYLIQKGTLEYNNLADAYIIKKETIINRDTTKSLIPVVAEGQKVANTGIIATYKNSDYDEYLKKLEQMDSEILELMQDLPAVYSGEIESLENQIRDSLKNAVGFTSYVDMQDSINSINTLINKRAVAIGELSPSGAAIKELIVKRNEYENNMKESNDNVKATATGIVSYKTDGLESLLKVEDISNLSFDKVVNLMSKKSTGSDIKIIDNYTCYIITQVDIKYKEYIQANKKYKLRIVGDISHELSGKLISYTFSEPNNTIDLIFQIENNIEDIATLRDIEIEIVWWTKTGMYLPNQAIHKQDDVNYIKIVKHGKYVEVPIVIDYQNEKNSIVSNYDSEQLEMLNIDREYELKLYDSIILN